jgi:hypothetical protein
MEAMQDKLIREKMNGLDSLPEGYAPSLESKWELLRAGNPEKTKRNPYFWYAAAASFLLLIGFGYLFIRTENQPQKISIARQKTPVEIEKANPVFPEDHKTKSGNKTPEIIIASTRTAVKNAMPETPKTNLPGKIKTISSTETVSRISEPVSQIAEEQPVLIAAEDPKATVKKRNRYVEVDFEAPASLQPVPKPTQTAQVQLKFRFLPQTSDAAPVVVQQEKPFRLQHTF